MQTALHECPGRGAQGQDSGFPSDEIRADIMHELQGANAAGVDLRDAARRAKRQFRRDMHFFCRVAYAQSPQFP